MIYLATILICIAILLRWYARREEIARGLPAGRIIYSDTSGWFSAVEPFYDPDLGLTGKPDYLVLKDGAIIPVEVKSTQHARIPYNSHVLQLAAYLLLVDRDMGQRPPYGILHYSGVSSSLQRKNQRTYAIDYTAALETNILNLIADMHQLERKKSDIPRSHNIAARCRKCGFRTICDQRL